MSDGYCLGIAREEAHSPGRETDDAEILKLTARHLETLGIPTVLASPDDVRAGVEATPSLVFLMCERLGILAHLARWEASGIPHVNRPAAVLDTYRDRMIARFHEAHVAFVPSRLVPTTDALDDATPPVWIKRADVHNTQEGDVVFAPTPDAAVEALRALAGRGIDRAVVQPHVPGDLVKFYGVGHGDAARPEPPWFRWFYHRDQQLAGHPFAPAALAGLAGGAALALGLEVYGGDAIVGRGGEIVLLDLNAWPSFALFREEAAGRIAAHLASRLRRTAP